MELLKIKNFPLPIWYQCSLKVCKRQDRFFYLFICCVSQTKILLFLLKVFFEINI